MPAQGCRCRVAENELRVCAARSRRRSSVGRTRGLGRVGLWRFHPGRSVPRPRITGRAARPRERGQRITVRSATFCTVAGIIWPRFGALVGVATAGPLGVPGHAATRPSSGRGGRCRSWSHGLMARERTDEDQPALVTVRTDHRLDRRHRLFVGRLGRRRSGVLQRVTFGWRLELQRLPDADGVVALCGM